MPEQNFDLVMRVVGGKVATAELQAVSGATEEVGAAQVAASKKSRTAAGGFAKHAVALGALYGGYKLLKGSLSTTVDLTRNTLAFQRATGLDYKTAQEWVVTAEHRSISSKQLGLSMATLGRQLGSLTPASKTSVAALKALGLSQTQLAKMPMTQRLDAIANAFKRMPNGTAKAAAAQRLFGRAGQGLLPILNQGAKGMHEQLDEAGKLVPATSKSAASAAKLMQQQRALNAAMLGVKVAIGSALIPLLSALGTAITPIATAFANLMEKSKLFRSAVLVLTAAITAFMLVTKLLIPTLYALGVSEDAALGPVGLIAAGIAAVAAAFYLAYHHVTFFHNAVDAVFGWIKAHWKLIAILIGGPLGLVAVAIATVITHFHQIVSAASSVVSRVKSIFSGLVSFFGGLPGRIGKFFSGVFNGLYNAAWRIVHQILNMFANLGSSIASTLGNAAKGAVSHIPLVGKFFKAEGGPITSTGSYMVGERGPEVVTLTKGSTVIPNHQLGALAGGGGGAVVHTHVYLDRKQIALAVGRYTSDQQKRR